MKAFLFPAMLMALMLCVVDVSHAGDGTMHGAYVRTIHARRPGLYFRVLSAITRHTPLTGPIPAPSTPWVKRTSPYVPVSSNQAW